MTKIFLFSLSFFLPLFQVRFSFVFTVWDYCWMSSGFFLSYFPLLKIILMKTVFSCCIVRCFVCCIIFSFEWIEIQRWKERESQCFSRWSCEFVSMNISRLRISWTHSREGEERVAFLLRIQMMFVQSGTKNVKQYTEREREKKRKNTIEYYSTLSVDPGIQAPWRVVYL